MIFPPLDPVLPGAIVRTLRSDVAMIGSLYPTLPYWFFLTELPNTFRILGLTIGPSIINHHPLFLDLVDILSTTNGGMTPRKLLPQSTMLGLRLNRQAPIFLNFIRSYIWLAISSSNGKRKAQRIQTDIFLSLTIKFKKNKSGAMWTGITFAALSVNSILLYVLKNTIGSGKLETTGISQVTEILHIFIKFSILMSNRALSSVSRILLALPIQMKTLSRGFLFNTSKISSPRTIIQGFSHVTAVQPLLDDYHPMLTVVLSNLCPSKKSKHMG
ncbi:hypothetical protein LINGRAHAP2_LOCUS23166 [Linum grandiflorum]